MQSKIAGRGVICVMSQLFKYFVNCRLCFESEFMNSLTSCYEYY